MTNNYAQLADGTIAPDFTLTDIDGTTHHLYDYLNAGKLVVLDFSATWCPPCWSYHNSGALEDLYDQYGPNGTNEVMVFMIEADVSTDMNDLNGNDPASMGDWISGTPYPIIDVQNSSIPNAYSISYFPTIYTICPTDFTVYETGQVPTSTLYSWVQSCSLEASFESVVDADCFGDGTASISVTGGLSPLSYAWSDGSSNADLTGVGGGNYSVTVTEANGKISVVSNILINGPTSQISISNQSQTNVECFGEATGQLSIAVSGGTPGYTIGWYSNEYPSIDGNPNNLITGLPAGFYNVVVVDDNDCPFEAIYEITQPPMLEVEVINIQDEECDRANGLIEFETIGGVGNHTARLMWPDGSSTTSSGGAFDNLPEGEYVLEVEDQNNCITTQSVTIEFINGPEIEVFSNTILTCQDPEILLEVLVTGGTNEFEYYWYTFDGNITSPDYLESVTINAPGEYFVEVVDFATGCLAENMTIIFADQDLPTISLFVDQFLDCETNTVTIDATQSTVGPDINTTWTDANGNVISNGGYSLDVTQPGAYTFTLTNSSNGCIVSNEVTVLDNSELVVPGFEASATELVATFVDISTGGAYSWSWDFGDGTSSTDQNSTHIYSNDGTYNVCLTAVNGCGSETICQEITVETAVTAIVVNGTSSNITCFGGSDGSIALDVTGGTGGYTYLWTGPGGFSSAEKDLNGLVQGAYSVQVTDNNGNQFSYTIELGQPDELGLNATLFDQLNCYGDATGQITVDVFGGVAPYSYIWSTDPSAESTIENLTAGYYSVVVIDANGCEHVSEEYSIVEPTPISLNSLTIENSSGVNATDGHIEITITGGTPPYNYNWSNGAATEDLQDLEPGTYFVEVTDANGCVFESGDIEVSFSVGLNDPTLSNAIQLMPNPANDIVMIKWELTYTTDLLLQVYNGVGQLIQSSVELSAKKGNQQLNVSTWESGLYFVAISDHKTQSIKKLMIQK
jgi:PKD repeat protein/thiol-disulfide isomerase/thioredoxin